MSGPPDELVADFAAETAGHLEELEPILMGAEWQPPSADAIAASLRCFHSIKGLSRVLGLHALERVAHDSETLLSRIRSNEINFDSQVFDALLGALDAMRSLRGRFLAGERELDAPPEVIDQLAACVAGGNSRTSPSTAESAPQGSTRDTGALHSDAETLACFTELLSETLGELAPFLDPAAGSRAHEQASDTADMLQGASQKLELGALDTAFGTLCGATPSSSMERVLEIAQVVVLVRRWERLLKAEAGAAALAATVESSLEACRRSQATALSRFLAEQPGELEAAEPSARRLHLLSQALGRHELAAALVRDAVAAWGSACVPEQADRLGVLATSLLDGEPAAVDAAAANLAGLLAGPGDAAKAVLDRRIDGAKLALLTPENRVQLGSLGEEGTGELFEVVLDVQSNARTLPVLAARLGERTHLLLGQPLTVDGRTSAALLLLADIDENALAAEIAVATGSGVPSLIRKLDGSILSRAFSPPMREASGVAGSADSAVRVPVEVLDRLFGRVGEFFQVASRLNALVFDEEYEATLRQVSDHVVTKAPQLSVDFARLDRHFRELGTIEADVQKFINLIHDSTLGLRVIPFDNLFGRFARLTHDMAHAQGKLVRFEGLAEGIQIDKGMAELLADPLMHMIRNAIDHGIETPEERRGLGKDQTAVLRITGSQTGNRILVDVADDGRGIDPDKVLRRAIANGLVRETEARSLTKEQIYRFVLLPGFSTADTITETSGRGVGMDVALVNVTRLGGRLDIRSTPGQGTRIGIELPLSAVIQSVLLVEAGQQTLALPERMIVETVSLPRDAVQRVNGQSAILLHDRYLPVFDLPRLLRLPDRSIETPDLAVLVLEHERNRIGVAVRRVLRRHDMLIRESHPRIASLPGIGGISTLGSDRVVLVIDPQGLFDLARRSAGTTLTPVAV